MRQGNSKNISTPVVINPRSAGGLLRKLLKNRAITVVESLIEDKKELALVKNPKLLRDPKFSNWQFSSDIHEGVWVYYPWRGTLVNTLPKAAFAAVRLSRNKGFISEKEQKKLGAIRVGIAGLNVGNPGALCMALAGVERFKLADNDTLSLSNLNRFRAGLPDLGLNKAILSARQIFETNPFARVEVWDKGISPATIENFLLKPKIDVLIEEMDNLPLKLAIRKAAQKHGIPVIMVTGNRAGLILDVERFDQKKKPKILNGYLLKEVEAKIENGGIISFDEKIQLMRDFMGKEFLEADLQAAFRAVGSKLAGIPQLAEASFLRGAVLSWALRKVALDALPSGRYMLSLDAIAKVR